MRGAPQVFPPAIEGVPVLVIHQHRIVDAQGEPVQVSHAAANCVPPATIAHCGAWSDRCHSLGAHRVHKRMLAARETNRSRARWQQNYVAAVIVKPRRGAPARFTESGDAVREQEIGGIDALHQLRIHLLRRLQTEIFSGRRAKRRPKFLVGDGDNRVKTFSLFTSGCPYARAAQLLPCDGRIVH